MTCGVRSVWLVWLLDVDGHRFFLFKDFFFPLASSDAEEESLRGAAETAFTSRASVVEAV